VARETLGELESQLKRINQVVPQEVLPKLQTVRFWVEWELRPDQGLQFHWSEQWLRENGYNPEKAHDVEISSATNFVNWSRQIQPCMALHELAHAYHLQILGEGNRAILKAYRQTMARGFYDSVEYNHRTMQRAYGASNEKEYFAELSEAYFGINDFFPYTRVQLRKYDPLGYQLMEEVWGQPRSQSLRGGSSTHPGQVGRR
jgi:hypothetical protein